MGGERGGLCGGRLRGRDGRRGLLTVVRARQDDGTHTVGQGQRGGAMEVRGVGLMGVEAAGEGGLVGRDAVCDSVRGAEGEGRCGAELTLGMLCEVETAEGEGKM